ncbi:hypothetical protein EON65_58115 [archaeon]|nr:MAG: hypothetical protein EON65_58115 [archaeon]
MPIIVIHRNDLSKDELPSVLEAYLSDSHWVVIRSTLLNVQRQAQGLTCAGELAACLCCGLWCVFCFHPCIYNVVLEQAWQG